MSKLFVGSLPFQTTDEELRDAFSQAGNVESAVVIRDRESGRSRGFGFVEMSNDDEAKAAQQMWDGKEFGGRNIVVNPAKERQ